MQRLLNAVLRSGLSRALDEAYDRHGRVRVNVLLGWIAISVISVLAVFLIHVLYSAPAIADLTAADPGSGRSFLWGLSLLSLVVVLAVSVATYMVLYKGVIKPVEAFRERIDKQLAESGKQQSAELAALSYGSQKRVEQLEAALMDNELMRREQRQIVSQAETLDQIFRSTFETITDRIIVVDAQKRVVEVSPLTTDLIGIHRSRVVGEDFDSVVNLYDPNRDNPLEYRIRDLVSSVIESGSAIPKITPVLLMTPHGAQEKILVSVNAILDGNAQVKGASIRFENDTSTVGVISQGTSAGRAKVDRVTGLPAREMFNSRLKELIEQARVRNATHTMVLFCLDNTASIHDSFGHRAAEELLWNIAQIIQAEVGAGTTCYRVTTRYIGLMFPFSERDAVETMCRRICGSVSGRVFAWREARYECTISGGAVEVGPDSEGPEVLLEHADAACMHARSLGGNRVQRWTPDEKAQTRRRSDQEWINWLMPRLDNGSLHLISQSIMPLTDADKRQPMFEVFMRVEDEDGVWISPGAFMPATARHQKCAQVDLAVIQTVLRELDRDPSILEKHACASINISGCALEDPEFVSGIAHTIMRSTIPGSRLCFEIDEPYVMSHRSVFLRFVNEIRPLGVKFALDHYKGAGGIDSLIDLPIDYVKIHESMVRRLAGDLSDKAGKLSLSWINEVCHARGIITIAAGIEDANAVDALKAGRTDFGQGVFLNKMGPLMA